MAIDNSFIIKKLQGLPEMFVIFSQSTKHHMLMLLQKMSRKKSRWYP